MTCCVLEKYAAKRARDDIKLISIEDRLWQKATDFIMRSGHTWGLRPG
jgi:hypothetical protein